MTNRHMVPCEPPEVGKMHKNAIFFGMVMDQGVMGFTLIGVYYIEIYVWLLNGQCM